MSDRPLTIVGAPGSPYSRKLRGEAQGRAHDALFWRSGHYRSILAGGWKLQVSERPKRTWLLIEGPIAIDHPLGVPDRPDDEVVDWAN